MTDGHDRHNPYAANNVNPQRVRGLVNHPRLLWLVFLVNVALLLTAATLTHLRSRYDDVYFNPVAVPAVVAWLSFMVIGTAGIIMVLHRLSARNRVPPIIAGWYLLIGVYIAWVILNFARFMMPLL